MSKENIKLFNEKLGSDATLQGKLKAINDKHGNKTLEGEEFDAIYENEIIPLAKESGFDFTLADVKEYIEVLGQSKTGQLSDDELNAVSGGQACACVITGVGKGSVGSCTCVIGGQGGNVDDNVCFCIIGGGG